MHNEPKNILFYFAWQLNPVHFGIVIEKLHSIVEKQLKTGGKVFFLYCDGTLKPCYTNREADPTYCSICLFNNKIAMKEFGNDINLLKLSDYVDSSKKLPPFEYQSMDDIRKITHKGVHIGYGALSSYISFTRNLEPVMDTDFRNYFDKLLTSQVQLTDAALEIIEKEQITECYFFNGRTADTRPMYDLCLNNKIPFISLEMIKKKDDEFYINEFVNCLPHDIDYHMERLKKLWEISEDSEEAKATIGGAFFEGRRKGMLVRERKAFTAGQQHGLLPDGFDPSKKNIGIFISSEDEFAAIGDIFEKLALFKTQEEGLKTILDEFSGASDYHFYIRIHPNLKGIDYSYHHRLMDMEKNYANATVVGADSSISSYALIDACVQTIVFGSTVGVEACYWDKPVILLAGAFYYHLDVTYKPDSKAALFELIRRDDLKAKSKTEAVKYGYYMMSYQKYTRKNKFSPFPIKIFGKQMGLGHHHLKVFGSSLLYRITERLLWKISRLKPSKKIVIPKKGI